VIGHVRLGRVFGVEIGLHVSWVLIAALIALSLASHFGAAHPGWSRAAVWTTALVTALLFFVAIVLHELSHALVARARGVPVRAITLFALGGVAQMERDAADPRTEFWMGIAGPIASAAIGAACLVLGLALGWPPLSEPQTPLLSALVWLGYINLWLAAFNLIPAFPMDGGRILRAALWWWRGDVLLATRWAARLGQVVAVGFILLGLVRFFAGAGLGGLWIAFIGWFLLNAAQASYGQVQAGESLASVRVGDVMERNCRHVEAGATLEDFVQRDLLHTGSRCFVVTERGRVVGLITLHEVKSVPRARWAETSVGEVMRPLRDLHTVSPSAPLSESAEIMGRDDVHQLPVLDGGRLLGVVSRGTVLQLLRRRAELQM
jgi:Zn-dependent protease